VFLVEAGEIYGRVITAPLVAIWQRELAHIPLNVLRAAFRSVLRSCRFFPTIADVFMAAADLAMPNAYENVGSGPGQIDYNRPEMDGCEMCRYTGWELGTDKKARLCKCRKRNRGA